MNTRRNLSVARACGMLATAVFTLGAQAAVSTYTASATFLAATTTDVFTDFDDLANQSYGQALTTHGISITSLPGGHTIHDVYIDPASINNFAVASTSNVLDANGDENFRFELASGASFNAIGFDFYANAYGAPSFSFFSSGSVLIAIITVNQTPATLGFIGFTSTTPIAFITSTVDRGWMQNTGYDNLRIGSVTSVPEPQAAWLLLAGLAAITGMARRRAGLGAAR